MEPQNISEKPIKNRAWIVATIWANIIIVGLILGVLLTALSSFMSGTRGWLWQIIMWLISISAFIYAIRLGVKSVLKKSVVPKEDIVKISIWVAMVAVIGQLGIIFWGFSLAGKWIVLNRLLQFIRADIGYFIVTYLWLKKQDLEVNQKI